jgi:hypothetical protein
VTAVAHQRGAHRRPGLNKRRPSLKRRLTRRLMAWNAAELARTQLEWQAGKAAGRDAG